MKVIFTILFIIFCLKSFCQKDTTIEISVKNQKGVTGYVLELSKDSIKWTVKDTFYLPVLDGIYQVPAKLIGNYYYRIHVLGKDQYSDIKLFIGGTLPVDPYKLRITIKGRVYE